MAVVIHFLAGPGRFDERVSKKLLAQHNLLMVKPGTATEAKPCHNSVSRTALLTSPVFPVSVVVP